MACARSGGQLKREGFDVAVVRGAMMRDMGLQGHPRQTRQTHDQRTRPRLPADHSTASSRRPGRMSCGSPTSPTSRPGPASSTSRFVIDAYARRIVAGRPRAPRMQVVLDALEQALHDRRPVIAAGSCTIATGAANYVSIKYTERLAESGHPSLQSVVSENSYDNALPKPSTASTKPS